MKPKGIRDLPNEILDKIADQAATPTNRKGYISGIHSKYYVNKLAKKYGGVKKIDWGREALYPGQSQGWEREALFYAVFPGRFDLREEMLGSEEVYKKYNPYKLPATYHHVNTAWNEVGDNTDDVVKILDKDWREAHTNELKEQEATVVRTLQKQFKKRKPIYSL